MKKWLIVIIVLFVIGSLLLYIFSPVNCKIRQLKHSNPNVRAMAAQVLVSEGSRAIKPLLDVAFSDSDRNVRRYAAQSLFELNYQPVTQKQHAILLILVDRWDEAAKIGVAAIDPLADAIKSDSWSAINALVKIKDPRVVELLITAMNNKDWFVRKNAAEAIVQTGDPRVVELLIDTLKDDNKFVREAAVQLLGQIKDPRAIVPLITSLKSSTDFMEGFYREEIIKAIIAINSGGPEALDMALKDVNWSHRHEAITMLGNINNKESLNLLVSVLKDKDGSIRQTAILSLVSLATSYESLPGAWEKAHEVLLEEVVSGQRLMAISLLIASGREETLQELKHIFDQYGDISMARTYINCQKSELVDIATYWLDRHGYKVTIQSFMGSDPYPKWGSFKK